MEPLRARLTSIVTAIGICAIVTVSCAETEAQLGLDPAPVDTFVRPDASAEASDADAAALPLCIATDCPFPLATCIAKVGSTYRCGVDLMQDPKNCGACGNECPTFTPLHMTSRCVKGKCVLECESLPRFTPGETPTDYRDCNTKVDDGCEADLLSDPRNCGSCGKTCAPGVRCYDGKCGCPAGTTDCGGTCVDLTRSDDNCGACFRVCDPAPAPPVGCAVQPPATYFGCVQGQCGRLKCDRTGEDCNGDLGSKCASNGCETDIFADPNNCGRCGNKCDLTKEECRQEGTNPPSCLPKCELIGKTTCAGFCADLLNDVENCGGCGLGCPYGGPRQTRSCVKGVCVLECPRGFADCNGDPSDGCETDLRVHPSHCGGCGRSCDIAAGQPCVEGKCLTAPCKPGETK
ncbi:MAG: hypothetical protein JST00_20175 [Deltaproteobacteria bacterium]|nr:hypothetical protein [Deltaproteobacteria bacterium]